MRLILSACSFRLQPPTRLVSLRGGLLRRAFHISTPTGESESPRFPRVMAKAFHGPDEELPVFDKSHLSFIPGQVLKCGDDEYRIERKLRGRLLSRVWLATHSNKQDPIHDDDRFVALETFDSVFSRRLSVGASTGSHPDLRYISLLGAQQEVGRRGSEYCDRSFSVLLGPHLCVVKEPCGPTLAALQDAQPHRSFALPVAKRIIKQTLSALDFIHMTMERTHIGVNAYSIQVALLGSKHELAVNIQDHLDSNPPQTVYNSLSGSSEGSTKAVVQALPAFGLSPSLDNLEIRLGSCEYATPDKLLESRDKDAGRTFTAHQEFYSPLLLAAPEAIQGGPGPRSPPINIWAVGHLLFQYLAGGELVYTTHTRFASESAPNPELPPSGELNSLCDPRALEQRLRSFAHLNAEMSESDLRETCALLARCFERDSAKRPTARELLEDEWFET